MKIKESIEADRIVFNSNIKQLEEDLFRSY